MSLILLAFFLVKVISVLLTLLSLVDVFWASKEYSSGLHPFVAHILAPCITCLAMVSCCNSFSNSYLFLLESLLKVGADLLPSVSNVLLSVRKCNKFQHVGTNDAGKRRRKLLSRSTCKTLTIVINVNYCY